MDIDKLCSDINKRMGLKDRDIGALIHVSSMTENSICRVDNEYGGITQLCYGEDGALLNFLTAYKAKLPKLKETNLVDISKITLENYQTYSDKVLIEDVRPYTKRKETRTHTKRRKMTEEERQARIKEYQHKYYLEKTKEKRKKAKEEENVRYYFIDKAIYFQGKKLPDRKVELFGVTISDKGITGYDVDGNFYTLTKEELIKEVMKDDK